MDQLISKLETMFDWWRDKIGSMLNFFFCCQKMNKIKIKRWKIDKLI